MSCNNTNFSNEKNTWSKSSNLLPTKWNPYPELMEGFSCPCDRYTGKKKAYSNQGPSPYVEKYEACALYASHGSQCNSSHGSMHSNTYSQMVKEDYSCGCSPQGYDNLDKTWTVQKPYTL